MDEMVSALVGIVLIVVLVGAVVIAKDARRKVQHREQIAAARLKGEELTDAPAGASKFFIATYLGNSARYFRVYRDGDSLLFVYGGSQFVLIRPETVRGTDPRGWVAQSGSLLVAGLTGILAVGGFLLVLMVKGIAGQGGKNPGDSQDMLLMTAGLIGLIAVLFATVGPAKVWTVTRRAAALNAMTLRELRVEAETDPLSFFAPAGSLSDVTFKVLDPSSQHAVDGESSAKIWFRHRPTGKWVIFTPTTRDSVAAARAFRKSCGRKAFEVPAELAAYLKPVPE